MVKIEFAFLSESERCKNAHSSLKKALGTLKGGDWIGESAEIFYTEMDSFVLPAMQRLVDAFAQAAKTTRDINQIFAEADKKATNNNPLLTDAQFFLKRFSGSYSDAESELLTRNVYDDTYINAPEGKGGTLDYSGLPSWLIPYALTLKISQPTPTPTSTPSPTPSPIPSSTPTPTPTDTLTPTPPTFTPKAP